ncbi:PepSY domain-containing protein [Intrasporangium sp.]|uniref:PepSY domain-containing protein n=1 Tax=Intrasporangium sp. TaxID=1925024 RepID=UPI003221AEF0
MTTTTTKTRRRRMATVVGGLALAGLLTACGVGVPETTVTPAQSTQPDAAEGTTAPTTRPTGTATQPSASPSSSTSPGSAPKTPGADLLAAVTVTPQAAAASARTALPSGRILSIELERSSGTVVWELDVVTRAAVHEVHVDAVKNKVIANRPDHSAAKVAKAHDRLDRADVSYSEALRTAARTVSGGRVVELELDDSHGAVIWEANVITTGPVRHELEIDARTGKVLEHETEKAHAEH